MFDPKSHLYQKGLIITDDIAFDPILDFSLYRDAILNIIRNSYPKFTIGILGDWGTGKTTLMDSVDRILQSDEDIFTVKFEAWRYEREEQLALMPLLKTIAFTLPNEPTLHDLKQKLKRGAINLLKKTPEIASSIVSTFLDRSGKLSEEAINAFRKEFNSKFELLAEVDRDTLYFDGFEDIRSEIGKILNYKPGFRIIVFVDDLDRCSPKKTLEVLESIKVFLGMEGFIYVLGISHDIVTKLIDMEYKDSGVKGEQYIKKMIQIPITLPSWNTGDIKLLIKHLSEQNIIAENYKDMINTNVELISTAIENNPREVKRFLNKFIVAHQIFSSKKGFNSSELLVIQVIESRWPKFYRLLIASGVEFVNELEKYLRLDDEQIKGVKHRTKS